jgi:5-methylcytosine-specific restriction endonuclease McrA
MECLNCQKEISNADKRNKYCSRSCAAIINNKKTPKRKRVIILSIPCKNSCGKNVAQKGSVFCSAFCRGNFCYKEYIERWKAGFEDGFYKGKTKELSEFIRRYIKAKYHNKCGRCNWQEKHPLDGKPPLEVEHIDGSWENNLENNLILLCPNCHSITPTYGSRNRGGGRAYRYPESKLDRQEGVRAKLNKYDQSIIATKSNVNRRRKPKNIVPCLVCGDPVNYGGRLFCSLHCQQEWAYRQNIQAWKDGKLPGGSATQVAPYVRRFIFEKYNHKCARCGWHKLNEKDGKSTLTVEHIDGNSRNTVEENLILLCPNCHSLTPTYKNRNRGRGRKYKPIANKI